MTRSMNFDVTANDSASREFLQIAAAAEQLENRLQRLDRLRVEPTAQLNITPATRSAQQLQSRLEALRNVRASVEFTGLVEARRDATALVVELRKIRNVRARVELNAGTARADVQAIAQALRGLRDARVRISLDTDGFSRDIARLHQRISALSGARVRIHIEVSPPGIREELNGIADALRRIRDTRARVTADTSGASAEVKKLGDALEKLGKATAISLSIPGLVGTIGQVGSLGASVLQLTGVLGLVPAAGFAAGAGIAAVAVGLNGLGDALGPTGTPAQLEKVNEAMARLSPAARELVTQIRGLGPAWSDVRLDVQERLLSGLGETVQRVGGTYMPVLKTGLGGIATELNAGARGFADWVTSGRTVNDVNTILGNTRETFRELAPAGTDVAAALTDIGVVGSGIMPELATGATAATGRFREFIAEARRTGELEQWIRGGISAVEQLGRIAGNTGGILGSVFSASEEAGYGFLDAVEQITGELDELLSSTSGRQALVDVFRESREAIDAALPGVRELGAATLETTGAFARSDGLERFAGLISQTGSALAPLVSQLGAVAGDGLGALASGASLAVSALTPLVSGTAAVVDGLGPLPGLVLASVVAFKGLSLATASVVGLGSAIAGTAALTGTLTAGLTGSLAAGAAAQAGMTRLGGAVSMLGRNLPLIGVGLVAAGFALDQFTADFDGATQRVLSGSQSMSQAIAEQAAIIDANEIAWLGGRDAQESYALAQEQVTAGVEQQIATMGPLEAAQARATLAQTAYGDAVRDFGPNSMQARDAAAALATATDEVEAAQRGAQQATMSHTDAMRDQVSAAQSALGANLDLAEAARQVAAAEEAANAAIRDHGASSTEAEIAVTELTRAAMQQADAAKQVAINQAEAAGSTDAAAAGEAAYAASLLNTAATLDGPARDAVLGQIASLSDAELAALSAGAAATGFATQLLTLPGGRTVTIAVDPETGEIVSTQQLLDGMQDADVAVNVETAAALAGLDGFIGIVNGAAGTVVIDGNPMAAGVALQTVLGQIAAGAAEVNIGGQTVPAQDALNAIIGQIGASGAQVEIGGQNQPAAGVLRDTLAAIAAGRENVTIGGVDYQARDVLGGLVGSVNSSNGTIKILGQDAGVAALKSRLSAPSSSTHTIYVRQMGALSIRDTSSTYTGGGGRATGGYVVPMASGGVLPPTTYLGRRLTRMSAARAEMVPRNTWRVIGDNLRVPEAYIPLDGSPRSFSFARAAVNHFGFDVAPKGRRSMGPERRGLPVVTPSGQRVSGGPMVAQMQAAMTQVRVQAAAVPQVDVGPVAREIASLRSQFDGLAAAVRQARPITVEGGRDPEETALRTRFALRL